jgi:hypothetical protein
MEGMNRREFLKTAGLAAASLAVAGAGSAQEKAKEEPKDPSKKAEKKEDQQAPTAPKDEKEPKNSPSPPGEEEREEAWKPDGAEETRTCPQCGATMYRQGRTWTCDNCGYSYVE